MRRLALTVIAGLAGLASPALAGIREATLEVTPTADEVILRIADTSARPVGVQRVSFRRPAGVRWSARIGARLGTVSFVDPGGTPHSVRLRLKRTQVNRTDRFLLANEQGLQVIFRRATPFAVVVRPPEGSTQVVARFTRGPSGLVRLPAGCEDVRFVAYLSPRQAGQVDDRAATLTAAQRRAVGSC